MFSLNNKIKTKQRTSNIIKELVRHAYIYVNAHLYQDLDLDWAIRPTETLNVDNHLTFPEAIRMDKLKDTTILQLRDGINYITITNSPESVSELDGLGLIF